MKEKMRFNFQHVDDLFAKNGYVLLSKENEYENVESKMKYICIKHKDNGEQFINVRQINSGHGCKYCGIEKQAESKRLDFEIIKQIFEKNNCILLSTKEDYKNQNSKLKYICIYHPGKEQYATYNSIQLRNGCRYCGNEKIANARRIYEIDFVKEHFKSRGYELLEDTYKNCDVKLKYICNKHPEHIQEITFYNFYSLSQGCKYCAIENRANFRRLDFDYVKNIFIEKT
jgi:hypothetical protein